MSGRAILHVTNTIGMREELGVPITFFVPLDMRLLMLAVGLNHLIGAKVGMEKGFGSS